jgi:stage V sporulation protein S
MEVSTMEIFKVSARSRSTSVAGAIAGVIREGQHAEVQAIGAGAVNQAIKAVAIARGYLDKDGIQIVCVPSFVEVNIEDKERTAVRLTVLRPGEPLPAYVPPRLIDSDATDRHDTEPQIDRAA